MIVKGIGATTHIDKHNCMIAKEALEDAVKDINEGLYAIGVGIEHDSTIMPIGKVISGKMVKFKDGEYGIEIEQELFDEYQVFNDETGEKWYIAKSQRDVRPFADTQAEDIHNIKVSIDPVNFSKTDCENLLNFYEKECLFETEYFMRKSVIPDPEIIFTLVAGTIAAMTGKKITEHLTDDIVKLYELIKKAVLKTVKCCKQSLRPITYVIRENSSYLMELVVVTEIPDILFEALQNEKLSQIEAKIETFTNNFNIDIAKVQCLYNIEGQEWIINYVSTRDGKVIGSEKCYKKTVELARKVGTELPDGHTDDIS
ncbi:hypothetical protein [Eisenbergiella tayi]|uniref:hypothetical protein n=1 Tax=Eisenbergiella tayi TaxID=1432052 RepID=UPI000848F574|nr:hypothetical protein [Eisenbergiella tayi]ODR36217.1 hypothetical protein BEI60_13270 [Eisenbergiella tayi]